jgi:hypothetical protein
LFGRIVPSDATTESRFAIRRNPKFKLQASGHSNPETLQTQSRAQRRNRLPLNGLARFYRPTTAFTSNFPIIYMIEPKPENLIKDSACDSDPLDVELRQDRFEMIAPHRCSKPARQNECWVLSGSRGLCRGLFLRLAVLHIAHGLQANQQLDVARCMPSACLQASILSRFCKRGPPLNDFIAGLSLACFAHFHGSPANGG